MAGDAMISSGSEPKRSHNLIQHDTIPGTVTEFQPRSGTAPSPWKYSGFQAAGDLPEPLRPCSSLPSHRMAKPSPPIPHRSEEHTSELQSLMRISYAVFCLKKKKQIK